MYVSLHQSVFKDQKWNTLCLFFLWNPAMYSASTLYKIKLLKNKGYQTYVSSKIYLMDWNISNLKNVFIWLKVSDKVKLSRLPWKVTKRNQCHGKNCLQIFVSLMSLVIDGRKSWKKLKSVLLYYLVLTTAQYEIFGFMMHCEEMQKVL